MSPHSREHPTAIRGVPTVTCGNATARATHTLLSSRRRALCAGRSGMPESETHVTGPRLHHAVFAAASQVPGRFVVIAQNAVEAAEAEGETSDRAQL